MDKQPGVARYVLTLKHVYSGQVFRVRPPGQEAYTYPPIFNIEAIRQVAVQDLFQSAEEFVEETFATVLQRENDVFVGLLAQCESRSALTWENLREHIKSGNRLVANHDFMSTMDDETKQHFTGETLSFLIEEGQVGTITYDEHSVPVFQLVTDLAPWVAVCPTADLTGVLGEYDPVTKSLENNYFHQDHARSMVVFSENIHLLVK